MSDLPPGFVLDPPKAAGLPPGFVLDAAPPAAAPKPVGAAMSVNNPPPKMLMQPPGEDADRAALENPGTPLPNARPDTSQRPVAPPPQAAPQQGRTWGNVLGEAVTNIPESAGHFAAATVQPVLHPVDTGNALLALGKGVASKAMPEEKTFTPGGTGKPKFRAVVQTPDALKRKAETEAPADAVGAFFADRYGSVDGFKNALATDPVGVAADVATVLTMGGGMLVRAPGVIGQGAQIIQRAGAAIDPLTQTGNVLKLAGKGVEKVASNALGMTTGAGPESIRAAGRAGREGGAAAEAFTENMRGNVPIETIVDLAKSGLEKIRKERADAYKAGKADLSKDATVLDFSSIDAAVAKGSEVGEYRGRSGTGPAMTTEPKAVAITKEMTDSIDAWKKLDPAEFHTPEGLDALKRTIGNIRDSTQYGSPERVAADRIYRAVRDEVAAQAPGYSKMMEDYAKSSEKIKEVTKDFSLGERATGETAARKLQSATRDGAQTSWRKRGELLNELATHEPTLPYAIAGQATNALAPRGIVARGGSMIAAGGVLANPLNALPLAAFSPRIVGETVYLGGKAVGGIEDVASYLGMSASSLRALGQASFQAGRPQTNAFARP